MGTANGFVPMVARWWEPTVELLVASGLPWPEETAALDLRWWDDYARNKAAEGVRFPGTPFFAKRWRWSRWSVERLLKDSARWSDTTKKGGKAAKQAARVSPELPFQQPTSSPPAAGQQSRNGSSATTSQKPAADQQPTSSRPAVLTTLTPEHSTQDTTPRAHARVRGHDETDSLAQGASSASDDVPDLETDPVVPKWLFAWLRLAEARPLRAVPAIDVLGGVNRVLEAIRGRPRLPTESAARPVLRLWVAMLEAGVHQLDRLVDDAVLLAHACQRCPDPIFANDVRGKRHDGTEWKKDTSTAISSVCRLAPPPASSGATWEERLDVARAWRHAGYPDRPSPRPTTTTRGPRRSLASDLLEMLDDDATEAR